MLSAGARRAAATWLALTFVCCGPGQAGDAIFGQAF